MLEAVGYDVGDAVHLIDQQTKETVLHELRKKEKLSRLELEAQILHDDNNEVPSLRRSIRQNSEGEGGGE